MRRLLDEHLKYFCKPDTHFIVCRIASKTLFRLRFAIFVGHGNVCTAKAAARGWYSQHRFPCVRGRILQLFVGILSAAPEQLVGGDSVSA
eukprot:1133878-Lingulodinium_polyedra.AAC.1